MGDPKKIRKKYSGPRHPWEGARIEEEKALIKEYGLKNKSEIWKVNSTLTGFKDQVKKYAGVSDSQADKEKQQLMDKLVRYGLVEQGTELNDVLAMEIKSLMERRLQSILFRQSLAKSMKQSRQFIVHGHVTVNGVKVTIPSYFVKDGDQIGFAANSDLKDEMHPERVEKQVSKDKIEKKKEKTEEEVLAFKEEEIMTEDEAALADIKKKEADEDTEVTEEPVADESEEEVKEIIEEGNEKPAEQSEAGDEKTETPKEDNKETADAEKEVKNE